jgi:hypothetical protein
VPRRATLLALAAVLVLGGCSLSDDSSSKKSSTSPQAPSKPGTPASGVKADSKDSAAQLGFPNIATKNTTRVSGGDAVTDVAGAVSAVFPATSPATRPSVIALVDKNDWQGALAASVLSAAPLHAPMLLSDGSALPEITSDTLNRLNPAGAQLSKGAQVLLIGSKPQPPTGKKAAALKGGDVYETAAAIDRFQSAAKGKPSADVIVTTGERAPYAMPAAAWAARSGDSILLVSQNAIPAPTAKALTEHDKPNIYLLGPEEAVSAKVEKELGKFGKVRRIEGKTPIDNAIAFARYQGSGNFGWGANVPGFNFTLGSTDRPLEIAAAAALGGNGIFAPFLLTDSPELPKALDSFFLDVQPGFEGDPRDGVYNHVWILGDTETISPATQGRLDEITQLIPVQSPNG